MLAPARGLRGRQIVTETGLVGLAPYVLAQIFLVMAILEVRERRTRIGELVWKYFLYVFLCYWLILPY